MPGIGHVVGTYNYAVARRLENAYQNIKYVAAYLAFLQDQWKKAYPNIYNDPGVLSTLYNIGVGSPHGSPKPSEDFGRIVESVYEELLYILWVSAVSAGLSNQIK